MARPTKTGIKGLYLDDTKRWRIDLRYHDATGRPQRYKEALPVGASKGMARTRATAILASALAGTLVARGTATDNDADDAPPTTLGAALQRYLEWCATNGSGRGDPLYKQRHVAHLLATTPAALPLASYDLPHVEAHKTRRRRCGKANGTINRELVTLKHFLNRAVEWGWLPRRPRVALLPEPPGRVRWLTDDERAKLDTGIPVRLRRVALASALCGSRLDNLLQLRRIDADFATRNVTLPLTKSGKRQHVPMTDALAAVLRDAVADGDAIAARKGLPPPTHVFLSRLGRPYSRNGASSLFRKRAALAGVEDFSFHDLRHDFATRVRRAGGGLDVVQQLLGQASLAMAMRYAHIGRNDLLAAASAAAAAIAPTPAAPSIAPPLPPAPKGRRTSQPKSAAKSPQQRAS